ncbi:unnamed protein product [Amoebophrya sp. A25]|nr:unnamed protein product [Amoebophrya sp. A25]|eukprot:GSA25T00005500001.1
MAASGNNLLQEVEKMDTLLQAYLENAKATGQMEVLKRRDVYDHLIAEGCQDSLLQTRKEQIKADIERFVRQNYNNGKPKEDVVGAPQAVKQEEKENVGGIKRNEEADAGAEEQPQAKRQKAAAAPAENAKPEPIELDGGKRITFSQFSGRNFVDMREWYSDRNSGELKPGKKGISLSISAYKKLKEKLPLVDSWLTEGGGDTCFAELEGQKRVKVDSFKGRMLVQVREFYDDKTTGEKKPGAKGIALTAANYAKFKDNLHVIDSWF